MECLLYTYGTLNTEGPIHVAFQIRIANQILEKQWDKVVFDLVLPELEITKLKL